MEVVSAITVGFTTSYYCSFTVYLLCVPTNVDTCTVSVDIHALVCHATYLLKQRGMSALGKGDTHGLAAAHFVVTLCIRWAWEIPARLWQQVSLLANF